MPLELIPGACDFTLCPRSNAAIAMHLRGLRAYTTLLLELSREALKEGQDDAARAFYVRELADASHDLRERMDALLRALERVPPCR